MARISQTEFEQLAHEHVPFVGMLGIQVESLEAGRASIRMPFREDFIRPGGTVSGPVQMALADIVMYAVVLRGCIKTKSLINMNVDMASSRFLADPAGRRLAEWKIFHKNQ